MSRLAGAAGLLVALVILELAAPTLFPVLVALGLIVGPAVNWTVAILLSHASGRDPGNRALRWASRVLLFLAIASTAAAFIAAIAVGLFFHLISGSPREAVLVALAYALFLILAPAIDAIAVWRPFLRREVDEIGARFRRPQV